MYAASAGVQAQPSPRVRQPAALCGRQRHRFPRLNRAVAAHQLTPEFVSEQTDCMSIRMLNLAFEAP